MAEAEDSVTKIKSRLPRKQHFNVDNKIKACKQYQRTFCTVADPAMGGPGGRPPSPHSPKIRAVHGGAKQSASNTGANFHLNP